MTADDLLACTLLAAALLAVVRAAVLPAGWFDQFARPDVYRMRRANRWRDAMRRNGGK